MKILFRKTMCLEKKSRSGIGAGVCSSGKKASFKKLTRPEKSLEIHTPAINVNELPAEKKKKEKSNGGWGEKKSSRQAEKNPGKLSSAAKRPRERSKAG